VKPPPFSNGIDDARLGRVAPRERGVVSFSCLKPAAIRPLEHLRAHAGSSRGTLKISVTRMSDANQLATAVLTFAFAVVMLVSARAFVEQKSASDARRPVIVASLPM